MNFNVIKDIQKKDSDNIENSLRPLHLNDFIGQTAIKENLKVFIEAAKKRQDTLDHILFYGPPGLGKTTLSQIISHEMNVGFKGTSGPIISKVGDLLGVLINLKQNDVLFIDEIHRLPTTVEEVLYSAMEDYKADIITGEGSAAKSITLPLKKFTLIGATTRLGLLSAPLRDRFGIPLNLDLYSNEELQQIIIRDCNLLKINITEEASYEIAKRSRGTPRIAIRLLKRVRDFAIVKNKLSIDLEIVKESLKKLNVDDLGLDNSDLKYLRFIIENYDGGPVGIDTISAGLSEEKDVIEDTIEPFLIRQGLINKTPRGRVATRKAFRHLNIDIQKDLLD